MYLELMALADGTDPHTKTCFACGQLFEEGAPIVIVGNIHRSWPETTTEIVFHARCAVTLGHTIILQAEALLERTPGREA